MCFHEPLHMKILRQPLGVLQQWIGLWSLLALLSGFVVGQSTSPTPLLKRETTPAKNLKVFDALWMKVNEKYFDARFNGINWGDVRTRYRPLAEQAVSREALLAVLRSAVGELNSSHVSVKLAVSRRQFEQQIGQKINRSQDTLVLSLGFDLTLINGLYVVSTTSEGSAARAAGVQPGWVLTHFDGKALGTGESEWGGEFSEGKRISARFLDHQQQEKQVTLVYQWLLETTQRTSQMLAGNIGLIRFSRFAGGTDKWLAQELENYRQARGVILDLRNNPGGYMSVLGGCLKPFFASPLIFGRFIERDRADQELRIQGMKRKAFAAPLVVLVDEKSSSCAEMFAAAMQETGRGKVIGRRTAGAVLASVSERLPEDFWLDIAIWDYKTARRRRLEGVGLEPDITVPLTLEQIRQGQDADVARALEFLQSNAGR